MGAIMLKRNSRRVRARVYALVILCFIAIDLSASQSKPIARIPIKLIDEQIFIELKVNGIDSLKFVFDTGSTKSLITKSLAERLGLKNGKPIKSTGIGGAYTAQLFTGNTIEFGNQKLNDLDLMVGPEEWDSDSKDGIIGYEFLSNYVVKVNHSTEHLEFYNFDDFRFPKDLKPIALDFFNGKIPAISGEFQVGNQTYPADFILDSGAGGYILLTTNFARLNQIQKDIVKSFSVTSVMGVDGNEITTTVFRISQLSLSDTVLLNIPSSFSNSQQGAMGFDNIDGLIGNSILKRFDITFNYRDKKISFQPNRLFNEEILINCFGALWKVKDKRYFITSLIPESSALEAGLKAGDELLEIDSTKLSGVSSKTLRKILSHDGQRIRLKYRRNDKVISTDILLKSMI